VRKCAIGCHELKVDQWKVNGKLAPGEVWTADELQITKTQRPKCSINELAAAVFVTCLSTFDSAANIVNIEVEPTRNLFRSPRLLPVFSNQNG
jgi:hypothetical protein